jgi:O-antigen ligase
LMFKRGSWVCACVAVTLFVVLKTNWKVLLLLVAVILAFTVIPPVRTRIAALRYEWNFDKGGRMTMWFKIAPALRKQYPLGIGYQVLTNEMMRDIDPRVERDRKHLHSNVVQVLVDTGWAGLLVYLAWMGKALFDAGWLAWRTRGGPPICEMFSIVLFLLLTALLLNGLVEYNFGRAPIVPVYGLIIGCIAAGRRLVSSKM